MTKVNKIAAKVSNFIRLAKLKFIGNGNITDKQPGRFPGIARNARNDGND